MEWPLYKSGEYPAECNKAFNFFVNKSYVMQTKKEKAGLYSGISVENKGWLTLPTPPYGQLFVIFL